MLAHARALLTSRTGQISYIDADARDTGAILAEAAGLLDFSQPIGVMLMAILHCVPDEDQPQRIVSELMGAVAPGSYLALTHPAIDQVPEHSAQAQDLLTKAMGQKVTFRSQPQVTSFFAGLDLVDPGVVPVQDWRPETDLDRAGPTAMWGGVARKA